tara:strand:- start:6877 stop:8388 length:1512 start_codon:yes stop_codon:yes gene_type:complete
MKLIKISNIIFSLILFSCSKTTNVPLPITTSSSEALEQYNRGYYEWGNHDGQKRYQYMNEALKLDPDFIMANLHINEPNPNKWKQYRDNAVNNKNNGSEAERIRVDIFIANREGNTNKAFTLAEELVTKYPNSSQAYEVLGNVYNNIRNFEMAEENYKKATKLDPNNVSAFWLLASHHINVYTGQIILPEDKRDDRLGIKYVDKMIKLRPEAAVGYQIKGNVERAKSNFEEAKGWYEKALEKRTASNSAISGLLGVAAHNYLFNGELDKAQEYYDKAIAKGTTPNSKVSAANFKIQSFLYLDDFDGAIKVSNELILDVDDFGFSKAGVLGAKAGFEMRKFLAHAQSQNKKDAYTALLAREKYASKRIELIDDDEIDRRNFSATNARMKAWYHILFGEYDKAKEELTTFKNIMENVESPDALDHYNAMMGMVALFSGNVDEAMSLLGEKYDVESYPYYSYFRALALGGSGESGKANIIFSQLANYNFNDLEVALVKSLAKKQLG